MPDEFMWYVVAGFAAQLVDGALGMAYGITASTLLLGFGVPPAMTSATVHAAECFTTGAAAVSHHAFGNVNRLLFRKLIVPAVIGAVLGAYVLASIPGDVLRPYVAGYLLIMGGIIILKAFREFPPRTVRTHLGPLGFVGAFIDALGGGGWGPIVATTLIVRGAELRITVGSVSAVEFFVTLAASLTFLLTLGLTNWPIILGLALGGVIAAPIGAWACTRIPVKPFMILIGSLVIGLSLRTILKYYGWI
ncbi:MAG TPA: sulfite exporter TauE/SafE family protein [Gemmatimonadales bacterium]|nr:sulfite exporter TauE/SafE family protein [Gemmatimonadales bacterium]